MVWKGNGLDEIGIDEATGKELVRADPRYFRPTEVDQLLGDPSKAAKRLGWRHEVTFPQPVAEMVQSDVSLVSEEAWRKDRGHY